MKNTCFSLVRKLQNPCKLFKFAHLEILSLSLYKSSYKRKGYRVTFKLHFAKFRFEGRKKGKGHFIIWVNHCLNPPNIVSLTIRLQSKKKKKSLRRLWSLTLLKITSLAHLSFFSLFHFVTPSRNWYTQIILYSIFL